MVAGINKNESAVETMIAIIVDTKINPIIKGRPPWIAIAGITDSLPDCLADKRSAGNGAEPVFIASKKTTCCSFCTKSGSRPFSAATLPVKPKKDILDSNQQKAFEDIFVESTWKYQKREKRLGKGYS